MCTFCSYKLYNCGNKYKGVAIMAKDKIIRMRASEYDKAIVHAIASKIDEEKSFTTKTSESDVLRTGIAALVLQYLTDDEVTQIRKQYMFKDAK